jgi:hypothetical protein
MVTLLLLALLVAMFRKLLARLLVRLTMHGVNGVLRFGPKALALAQFLMNRIANVRLVAKPIIRPWLLLPDISTPMKIGSLAHLIL